MRPKVLFVCIHNSGRSQMAQAWLEYLSKGEIEVMSAGFKPSSLNPLVVKAMAEVGIDISSNSVNSVFEYFKQGLRFNYIITVCDEGNAQKCPLFPGLTNRIHWSFKDPATLEGDEESKIEQIRTIRDAIRKKVEEFIISIDSGSIKENSSKKE